MMCSAQYLCRVDGLVMPESEKRTRHVALIQGYFFPPGWRRRRLCSQRLILHHAKDAEHAEDTQNAKTGFFSASCSLSLGEC